jgi:hypothetical protein
MTLRAFAVALLLACAASCLAQPAARPSTAPSTRPAGRALVLMHYMPWYETPAVRGRWGAHWTGHEGQHRPDRTGADGLPDLWSHFHPLIGPYDSVDPAALECHLLQMKLAGVDGVIVDWYGIAKAADYPPIHDATRAMFDAAGRFEMRFAVCYEDRTVKHLLETRELAADRVAAHLAETFRWMHEHWFGAPHYVRLDGRPLVLNFGPIHVTDPAAWEGAMTALPTRPRLFALHHLWRNVRADGGFTWVHTDEFRGNGNEGDDAADAAARRRLGETFRRVSDDPRQTIVSAYPGFRDVYAQPLPTLDHGGGRVLRDTLAVALGGDWPVVQLVTWNDYGEGTMIEPTHEFGYTFLEIVQEACRRHRRGDLPFTADDLRLPARLYALRRRGDMPAAKLDAISALLRDGKTAEAGRELDALGAPAR